MTITKQQKFDTEYVACNLCKESKSKLSRLSESLKKTSLIQLKLLLRQVNVL